MLCNNKIRQFCKLGYHNMHAAIYMVAENMKYVYNNLVENYQFNHSSSQLEHVECGENNNCR